MRGPISYLDFYLQLSRTERGYRAQVLSSPAGEASSDFLAPFSELELENFVLRIGRPRRGMRRIGSPEMEALKTLGKGLYDAVLSGDVRACWSTSLREAEAQNAGLRLRLRIADAPELNDIPWEYLYNSNLNRFLSLSEYTPLIRFLDLPERIRPLPVDGRLEILVMISSPTDYPGLNVENEWSSLNEALAGPIGSGQVRLHRLPEARLTALQRELRRGEYHILHFIGHAGFDREAQGGVLVLCDDAGKGRRVVAENLGFILHDHRSLRLVVLNACEGSRASRADPFAGVAQTLVQQGVPAVIAMQFEITDQAAITFAEEFYTAVADGHPVDAALADARKAIFGTGNEIEWGTPVLYLRAPDGRLFSVNPDALAARKLAEEARQAEEAKQRAEEAQQTEEAKRRAEEARQAEEAKRRAEEARQAEEAKQRAEEARQAEEAKRRAEEAQQAEEAKQRAEEARQAEEAKRRAEEAQQAEEAKRRAEEAQQAEEAKRRAEEARQAEEAKRRAEEARQAEEAKQRAEEARQAEEAKQRAEEARQAEEAKRRVEEAQQAEEAKRRAEEAQQVEEAKRRAEEAQQAEEAKRRAEEAQQVEEAKRRAEEAQQAEEAKRRAEEARQAEEAKRRAEEARQAEEAKQRAEEARQAEEAKQRAEEARQAEEAKRRAEEAQQAEEAKRRAEAARHAEEAKRRAEAAQQAEEAKRRAEEARQAKEAKRRAEAARQAEEAKRRAEEARQAEEAKHRAEEIRLAEEAKQRAEKARRTEEAKQRAEKARQQRQSLWGQRKKRAIALARKVAIPAIGIMLFSVIAGSFALILPQPPTTGTLRLSVTPADAALSLDGIAMGWANGQEVLTGGHVIEISAAGYQSKREIVTVPSDREQTMNIALETQAPPPTTGTLRLDVTPADAALMLDGAVMELASDFRQELSAGTLCC